MVSYFRLKSVLSVIFGLGSEIKRRFYEMVNKMEYSNWKLKKSNESFH